MQVRVLTRTALTISLSFITDTEILNWVYRALGAKIGKRCRIGTLWLSEWDLVEIGDDCVIEVGFGCQANTQRSGRAASAVTPASDVMHNGHLRALLGLQAGVRLSPAELSAADGGVLSLRKITVGAGSIIGTCASLAPGTVTYST